MDTTATHATLTGSAEARAARVARLRARRADAPGWGPETTVPVTDLRVGDWLVKANPTTYVTRRGRKVTVRGVRYGPDAAGNRVTVAEPYGLGRTAVASTEMRVVRGDHGEPFGSLLFDNDTTVVVRRPL